jgi:hypothetical protein
MAIVAGVVTGELTPSEASELAKVVESYTRTLQAVAFEERLVKLEQKTGLQGTITPWRSFSSHSITSSAPIRKVPSGTRPSARALRRLTTKSNREGSSIGRSPGFAPFRMRST